MIKVKFDEKALQRNIKNLTKRIEVFREDIVMPRYFQRIQSTLYTAQRLGRQVIADAHTPTGEARARAGGEPGRIETGAFVSNFKTDGGRKTPDGYLFKIGWLDDQPDWAKYQELGFKHRGGMIVAGADALGEVKRYIESELEKIKK